MNTDPYTRASFLDRLSFWQREESQVFEKKGKSTITSYEQLPEEKEKEAKVEETSSPTEITTSSDSKSTNSDENNPIQELVEKCMTQFKENPSGRDPTKERIGTQLFSSYRYLSNYDKKQIKKEVRKIQKAAKRNIARLEKEKNDEIDLKTKKEHLATFQQPIQERARKNPEFYTKLVTQDPKSVEYARCDAVAQVKFSKEKELKQARNEEAGTKWILENISCEGALGKSSPRRKRARTLSDLRKHPLILADGRADRMERFEKDCENLFKKKTPKSFAKALIAQDLKMMKHAVTISDIAPAKETKIGQLATKNYNRLTSFVTDSILLAPDLKTAAKRIRFFCKTMQQLEKFEAANGRKGDHISFLAIGDALNAHNITRIDALTDLVPSKYAKYLWSDQGNYHKLSKQYADVGKAFKLMSKAGLISPGFLSTALDRAGRNSLENRIETISKFAFEFKKAARDLKGLETPTSKIKLHAPKLPTEGFEFPEGHEIILDSEEEEYLYLRSNELKASKEK